MQVSKILARGQVTLPRRIRQAAGLRPGDVLAFEVLGPGKVEVRALSGLTLEETFAKYEITEPIDDAADREKWQDQAARDVIGA